MSSRRCVLALVLVASCVDDPRDRLPAIGGISPAQGPADHDVALTIAGTALAPDGAAPRVYLGTIELTAVRLTPDGDVVATVPAGLDPGVREVRALTTRSEVAAFAPGYAVVANGTPLPAIAIVSPSDGQAVRAGASVVVRVTAHAPVGHLAAIGFDADGAATLHHLDAVTPPTPSLDGSYTIAVPVAAANGSSLALHAYALDDETPAARGDAVPVTLHVSGNPLPTATAIAPARGPLAGGTQVQVRGHDFTPDTVVAVGGQPLVGAQVSTSGLIVGAVAAHAAAVVDVGVHGENGDTTLAAAFEYVAPPLIAQLTPPDGPRAGGVALTIAGANFVDVQSVTVGGAALIGYVVDTRQSLHGTLPPGIGLADVTLVTSYGATTAAGAFAYDAPATIAVAAHPAVVTADGVSTATLVATVSDTRGRPVAGEPVSLSAAPGALSPITDRGDGTYTAIYTAPTRVGAGVATVTARDPDAVAQPVATTSLTLAPGPAKTAQWLSLLPASLAADGQAQAVGVFSLADANGNPVPGAAPSVTATGGVAVAAPLDQGGGQYRVVLTAPARVPPGATSAVTVTAGAATASTTLALHAGPAAALSIETAGGGAGVPLPSLTLTAGMSLTVYAVLRDAFGNFVGDVAPAWSSSQPLGTFGPANASAVTFHALYAGTLTLGASDGVHAATSALLTIAPGALAGFVAGVMPTVEAGVVETLFIFPVDSYFNRIAVYPGAVSIADLSGAVSPSTSGPFVNGGAYVDVRFGVPWKDDQVLLSDGAGHTGRTTAFDVLAFSTTVAAIVPTSGYVDGGDAVTITGTGFAAGDVASLGGRALLQATIVDAQTITGVVPAAAASGAVDVTVLHGGVPATLARGYTYTSTIVEVAERSAGVTWSDTTLRSQAGATSWNFGAEPTLGVGTVDAQAGPGPGVDRALVQVDVKSVLPPGAEVLSASLDLWATATGTSRIVPLTLTNPSAAAWPVGTPIVASWNHAAAVASNLSAASGDDVHLLYRVGGGRWTDLPRLPDAVVGWNAAATGVWFALASPLAAGADDATSYAIGYGLVAAPPYAPQPTAVFPPPRTATTQALYYCDDRAGLTLADASGFGRDAILNGFAANPMGAGWASGGVHFDGVGSGAAPVPYPPGDVTIETWFRTTTLSAPLVGYVANPPMNQHLLALSMSDGALVGELSVAAVTLGSATSYADGAWHHAALVLSGSGGPAAQLTLYGDGKPLGAATVGVLPAPMMPSTFQLGAAPKTPPFVGALDGVSVRFEATSSFPYATPIGDAQPGTASLPSGPHVVALYRLYQPWTEGSGTPSTAPPASTPASWTARDAFAWARPGASAASDAATDGGAFDRAATPLGALAWTGADSWYSVDVTAAAIAWADGAWSENGLVLQALDESDGFARLAFASAEATDPTHRPRLTVRYIPAPAVPASVDVPASAVAWIASGAPDTVQSAAALFMVSSIVTAAQPEQARALLRFDVGSVVPAGKTILAATLLLTRSADVAPAPDFVTVRALAAPFAPAAATWNTSGLAPWIVPGANGAGGDWIEGPLASSWGPFGAGAVDAWDLTGMVQSWVDAPATNYGLLLAADDPLADSGAEFVSASGALPTAPVLRVQYRP